MIDPYFFRFKGFGYPDNFEPVEIPEDCWKVYMLSSSKDERNVFVYTDRKEFRLSSKKDDKDVVHLYNKFINRCSLGMPFQDICSDSEYHDYTEVKRGHDAPVTVMRLRKSALRLCMVFCGANNIVLFRLSTKRQDKISKSEQNIIESRVHAIFKYPCESNEFLVRVL